MRVVGLGIGTTAQMQRDRQAVLLGNCELPTEHIPLHIAWREVIVLIQAYLTQSHA